MANINNIKQKTTIMQQTRKQKQTMKTTKHAYNLNLQHQLNKPKTLQYK